MCLENPIVIIPFTKGDIFRENLHYLCYQTKKTMSRMKSSMCLKYLYA